MSETPPTDTPLYAATLSDMLASARDRADRFERRAAEAERRAAEVVAKVQAQLARAERLAEVRQALVSDQLTGQVAEQVAEQVRTRLALNPPPLPELEDRTTDQFSEPHPGELEREAPPVPSVAELLLPSPGVTRFLDALLGPTEP